MWNVIWKDEHPISDAEETGYSTNIARVQRITVICIKTAEQGLKVGKR